ANVAIAGTQAVVVDQDVDSVSIIDLDAGVLQKTLAVGRGPKGVAADAPAHLAYRTQDEGGILSLNDLNGLTIQRTIARGRSVQTESIAVTAGGSVAFVAVPSANASGQVLLVDLTTGTIISTLSANPDHSGGVSDVVVFKSTIYFANQAGGS